MTYSLSERIATDRRMKTATAVLMTLLRVVLGAILLFSGTAKVDGFGPFITAVESYHILPAVLIRPASYLLVSAEITLGIALCIGYRLSGAGAVASLLFLCFALALASVLWRQVPLFSCGCENLLFEWLSLSQAPTWQAVCIDGISAAASLFIAFSRERGYSFLSIACVRIDRLVQ